MCRWFVLPFSEELFQVEKHEQIAALRVFHCAHCTSAAINVISSFAGSLNVVV